MLLIPIFADHKSFPNRERCENNSRLQSRLLINQSLYLLGKYIDCIHKQLQPTKSNNLYKVDSRVRVQLSPSPVNHEKNTNRLNKWFRFI